MFYSETNVNSPVYRPPQYIRTREVVRFHVNEKISTQREVFLQNGERRLVSEEEFKQYVGVMKVRQLTKLDQLDQNKLHKQVAAVLDRQNLSKYDIVNVEAMKRFMKNLFLSCLVFNEELGPVFVQDPSVPCFESANRTIATLLTRVALTNDHRSKVLP